MNNLQIFNNQEFGQVRVLEKDGQPWFVAKDVCDALKHSNSRVALSRLDDDEKGVSKVYTPGGHQEVSTVNEYGLYSLVLTSNLPKAKQFKRWITHEVIPSIRKHGMYAKDELLDNPDLLLDVIQKYKAEREEKKLLQAKIEQDKPKILFAEALEIAKSSILVGELAKLLARNGIEDMGQNRLFKWLRANGYLHKTGEQYNMPTQKSTDLEIMEVKTTTTNNPDGSVRVNKTPKVTCKGQIYFINKFKNNQIAM